MSLVIGLKVLVLLSGICVFISASITWSKNSRSAKQTVKAEIIARRADVGRTVHLNGPNGRTHFGPARTCYVTFQTEDGRRMEFYLAADKYGRLAEGAWGELSYQGNRYLGFEPIR